MFTISKEFHFSAAHQLHGLADDHPCSRVHGHNYIVKLELQAPTLNEVGFVRDYRELDDFKHHIDAELDHRNLNDVFKPMQTSAENIARAIFMSWREVIPQLVAVHVSETPKTWATYRPQ